MILLLGGARSGKSALAGSLAVAGGAPVRLIATAEARDDEMADRIAAHEKNRPAGWTLVEAPIDVETAVLSASEDESVVVDCVTLWISNLIQAESDESILERVDRLAEIASSRAAQTIVVSNEVGSGVVPVSALGRRFRDLHGRANQRLAEAAETSVLVVAGKMLRLEELDSGL